MSTGRALELVGGPVAVRLPAVLRRMNARRVLVVTTRGTLRRTGALEWFAGRPHEYFVDVSPNPQLADVMRGVQAMTCYLPDVVVGIGGASVLDTAKAVRLLPPSTDNAARVLAGQLPPRCEPPGLVLVPTTAGPGSEVTSFATIFTGTRKRSLDHPSAQANVALVDPSLTYTCPPELSAHCALDATAHALESWWSVRSTERSRHWARQALIRLVPLLRRGFHNPSPAQRRELSAAAVDAGQAINITRTTAGHAFAYPTTAHFGVPHGLACALHLVWLLPLTLDAIVTGRSSSGMRAGDAEQMMKLLGAASPALAGDAFAELLCEAGCPTTLGAVGVRSGDLAMLLAEATTTDRIGNHPAALIRGAVLDALGSRL